MTPSSIHIVARVTAKPDAVKALQTVLETLLTPTRQEPGCRRYVLMQNQENPTDFTFVEEWADEDAINSHMKSAHLKEAFTKAAGLLAAPPDIQRYTLIG
jgi:quinol monooxygenase YgiN